MPRLALWQRNRRPAAVLTPARCGLQYVGKRYAGWVKKEAAKRATQEHAEPFNGDADQCREDLTEHYAKVVKFATQESKVIKRVFPHPEKLLGKLTGYTKQLLPEFQMVQVWLTMCQRDKTYGVRPARKKYDLTSHPQ